MVIVRLEDGTTYYIDTNNKYNAREVVKHKLRGRLDYRKIESAELYEELTIDKSSRYYNSGDEFDRVPLKCKTGWSYKWSDVKCAEFR